MNQHQRSIARIERGFAVLTELSGDESRPTPEMTLMMPGYIDPDSKAFVPASSITICSPAVKALHALLGEYYAQAKKA